MTELGGELVNTDHRDMLALVRAFGIELINLHEAPSSVTRSGAMTPARE